MDSRQNEIDILLPRIVRCCRVGDYSDAARELDRCIRAFQLLQQQGRFKDLSQPLHKKIHYSLETILMMLAQKDWVAIADIMEFELRPLWQEAAGTM